MEPVLHCFTTCLRFIGNGLYAELIRAQKFDKKPTMSSASSFISGSGSGRRKEVATVLNAPRDDSVSRGPVKPAPQERKNALQLIKRCFVLSRREIPVIAIGLGASIVSGAMSIGEAFIFGNLVELLNSTSDVSRLIAIFCLLFFALAVVALFARVVAGSAFGYVSENLVLRVRDVSFRTVLVRTTSIHMTIYSNIITNETVWSTPILDLTNLLIRRSKTSLGSLGPDILTMH
jgi:hypothetical protein